MPERERERERERDFTERSYIMLSLDFFWTKRSAKYSFFEIREIFNVINSTSMGC